MRRSKADRDRQRRKRQQTQEDEESDAGTPSVRSLGLSRHRSRGHAVTVVHSSVPLFLEEKLVVELDESSDGLNDEEKAQMEAIQAKARARKEEKNIDASPLSIETLRPLLKEMVKQGIADAINPVVDRMERHDRRIQDLTLTRHLHRVRLIDLFTVMALHVVYKYNLAAGETKRHPHRLSHVWSNARVVGRAVCHGIASRAARHDAAHEASPSIAPREGRHADDARGRRATAKASKRRRHQSPQPSRRPAKKTGAVKRLEDALHDESADNSGDDVEPLDEGEHCHAVHMRPNVSRYPVAGRRSASRDRARLPKDARSGEARRKAESRVPSVERRAGRSDAGDPETPGKSEVSQSVHPVCPYCHAVHISVLPLGLPIGRRMAVRWDDYGPDALGVSKAERRRQFLEFMSTVATFADVSVEKKQESVRTRSVVLSSKNRDAQPDSLAFTTTPALVAMCKAWWSEFEERDGDAVSPQVKLRSLFRGSMSRNIARMYESPDNLLRLDAPSAPPAGYPWLPIPTKRVEIEERDVRFLESTARLALRASNFSEVLLQAWDASLEDVDLHIRMKKCLSSVVKTFMQTQVAIANGCLQLRRDHYLASAKGLSADAVARLRHAPALEEKKLFPPELLKDVDELNQKQIQTKAFLRFATASTPRPRASRGRGKSDGDFRTGYHPTSTRHAQDPHQSSWYGRFYRASAIPVPVASRTPQKRGGGGTKSPINCSNSVATQVVSARESSIQPAVTASVTLSSSVTPSALTVTPSTGSTQAPRLESEVPSSVREEAEALAVMQPIPVGGRLQFFWRRWRALGASKRVSRWLRRGYRLPFAPLGESSARALFRTSCPPALVVSYANPVKMRALLDLVETLLSKHVVEPVPADTPCLHNIVFLRPKPNGTWRLILDVSALNKFLVVKTFSMDTAAVIRHAVTLSRRPRSAPVWTGAMHTITFRFMRTFAISLPFKSAPVVFVMCAVPSGSVRCRRYLLKCVSRSKRSLVRRGASPFFSTWMIGCFLRTPRRRWRRSRAPSFAGAFTSVSVLTWKNLLWFHHASWSILA